jgi:hypothetical protein
MSKVNIKDLIFFFGIDISKETFDVTVQIPGKLTI